MNDEYKSIFKELGYDVNNKGSIYYGALLDDVVELVEEGKSTEEIKNIFPSICLELYHFYFEVAKPRFLGRIEEFRSTVIKSKNRKSVNELLEMGLDSDGSNMELDDSAIYFAKYIVKNKKLKENENSHKVI